MKKTISIALVASILGLNCVPVFAVNEENTEKHAPRQFKSMVSKNKRTQDDYKLEYVNLNYWAGFNDEILNAYIQKAILNNYDLKMATLATEEYYQQVKIQFANELHLQPLDLHQIILKCQKILAEIGCLLKTMQ